LARIARHDAPGDVGLAGPAVGDFQVKAAALAFDASLYAHRLPAAVLLAIDH